MSEYTYKCRANNIGDIDNMVKWCNKIGCHLLVIYKQRDRLFFEEELEFKTDLAYNEVLDIFIEANKIIGNKRTGNIQVMCQTLQYKTRYTGLQDYEIEC